ncbi:MAG: YggS family pyridoxal phosphate-dependent enzyme, partial [Microscillaceae bacterium]|nr:YggS family pyridoxal phosphate-dependent enzyme [Microscillaceae bacterium]
MEIIKNLEALLHRFDSEKVKLVAVSKTHPPEAIQQLYDHGWRRFGENKVQELSTK